jgi:uracil-DNA glycosylase family 4
MTDLQGCQLCPRLTDYRASLRLRYPHYHCAPVAGFGSPDARLLIVGLAPGLHGANASGRPFTGDASGDLLFTALHRHGFASQANAGSRDDGMRLVDCRITNSVKCVPPGNLPKALERNNCNRFLAREIEDLPPGGILFTLGGIAHRMAIRALGLREAAYPFGHARRYRLDDDRQLFASYHPSRYNINTGRLSAEGFASVIHDIREALA